MGGHEERLTPVAEPPGGPVAGHAGPGAGWRAVVGFGLVSLAADVVYEGARSVTGPLLASLGASGLLVGLVTGGGEAAALVLRLPAGARVDRSGGYWAMTTAGYGTTAVAVPALAATPFLGPAALAVACVLVLAERAAKAVRSPAKSTLLAHAAGPVGLGRGFGVHKALDQIGAFAGPLLVAAAVAATGVLWPAFALLAVPGAVSLLLLARLRRVVGEPAPPAPATAGADVGGLRAAARALPRSFWLFAAAAGLATAGLVTFGVLSFSLVRTGAVSTAAVPLVYAAAMAAEAVAALVTGWAHDRWGARGLLVLPFLVAAVPVLGFSARWPIALAGVLLWGAATGLQDSTVKALVAQLVPAGRRATGYGLFAVVQGAAAVTGGALAGALFTRSVPALAGVVGALQLAALVLLVRTLRASRTRTSS